MILWSRLLSGEVGYLADCMCLYGLLQISVNKVYANIDKAGAENYQTFLPVSASTQFSNFIYTL